MFWHSWAWSASFHAGSQLSNEDFIVWTSQQIHSLKNSEFLITPLEPFRHVGSKGHFALLNSRVHCKPWKTRKLWEQLVKSQTGERPPSLGPSPFLLVFSLLGWWRRVQFCQTRRHTLFPRSVLALVEVETYPTSVSVGGERRLNPRSTLTDLFRLLQV